MKLVTVWVTGGKLYAKVDEQDFWNCCQYTWHFHRGYARSKKNGKHILLHRFILGIDDPILQVDHEDRDKLNCRRYNLRIATHEQNVYNRAGTTGRFKGVHSYRGKWRAMIQRDCLGVFGDEEVAARVYDKEALKRYGRFAYLNFPEEYNGIVAISFP